MGAEDFLFLPSVRKAVLSFTNAQLCVVENSGHVVNIDQPKSFNDRGNEVSKIFRLRILN